MLSWASGMREPYSSCRVIRCVSAGVNVTRLPGNATWSSAVRWAGMPCDEPKSSILLFGLTNEVQHSEDSLWSAHCRE